MEHDAFREYPSFQILHIYDVSVVVCATLWFAAASLVGKSPPKRRKYAEFGTMCIRVIPGAIPNPESESKDESESGFVTHKLSQ